MENVIFALPYTSNITADRDVVLSSPSTMSATATGLLLQRDPEATVVIAGEHTFGRDYPSTGELMAQEICAREGRVVLLEHEFPGTNLNNTAFQVQALNLWLQNLPEELPNITTVGHAFHLSRVALHMARYGVPSWYTDAAEVISQADLADQHPEVEHLRCFERRERIVWALAQFDRKGDITKRVTERVGPHVHDIKIDELTGEVVITDISAKKRLAELDTLEAPATMLDAIG